MSTKRLTICKKIALSALILLPVTKSSASELDAVCEKRVKGEFIVQKKISLGALSAREKASAFERFAARKNTSLKKHVASSVDGELISLRANSLAHEEDVYRDLLNDPEVESVTPNCLLEKQNVGRSVSGKVVVLGGEGADLPNITFGHREWNRYGTFSNDISIGQTALSFDVPAPFITSQHEHIQFTPISFTDTNTNLLISTMRTRSVVPGTSDFYWNCSLGIFEPEDYENDWATEVISLHNIFPSAGTHCITSHGDITGNGRDDIVIVGNLSVFTDQNKVVVISNDLTLYATLSFAYQVHSIRVGDIDRDGRNDIIALTREQTLSGNPKANIEILRNLGGGVFSNPIVKPLTISSRPYDAPTDGLALGDINQDGKLDILIAGDYKKLYQILGNGTVNLPAPTYLGELSELSSTFPSITDAEILHLEDLNNDSYPDIVAVYYEGIVTLKNVGGSFYYYNEHYVVDTNYNTGLTFSDVNGDGFTDIIFSPGVGNATYPYLNTLGSIPHPSPDGFPDGFLVVPSEYQVSLPYPSAGVPLAHRVHALRTQRVRLQNVSTPSQQFFATTRADGTFSIAAVPNGQYRLSIPSISGAAIRGNNQIVNVSGNSVTGLEIVVRDDLLPGTKSFAGPYTVNDPAAGYLWGLHQGNNVDIDAPEAWGTTRGYSQVVVAVIDDGYDYTHPDLSAGAYRNPQEVADGIDNDGNGFIDDLYGVNTVNGSGDPRPTNPLSMHGTHVSGTINAALGNGVGIVGVAPGVKVMGVKVFSDDGPFASLDDLISGLHYISQRKARGENIRVLNGSLGMRGSCPAPMLSVLRTLATQGVSLVFAAGNAANNNDATPYAPTNCDVPGLISVASVDSDGALSSFSNFGAQTVDVAAPGRAILSTTAHHWGEFASSAYDYSQGTSMAAPHVAGVSALLSSVKPSLTPSQIRSYIISASKQLPSLSGKTVSGGLVSAKRALDSVLSGGQGSGGGGQPDQPSEPSDFAGKVHYHKNLIQENFKKARRFITSNTSTRRAKKAIKQTKRARNAIKRSVAALRRLERENPIGALTHNMSRTTLSQMAKQQKLGSRAKDKVTAKKAWKRFLSYLRTIR